MGSRQTCTLSLKTTHRQAALTTATNLLSTFRAFHLGNPEATWEQLKEGLKEIAESVLQSRSVWEGLGSSGIDSSGHVYSDIGDDFSVIAATEPLSVDQTKALALGRRMMLAAEKKTAGDPSDLLAIIEELRAITSSTTPLTSTTGSTPTAHPVAGEAITFETLYKLHMEERQADWQPATLKNKRACYGILAGMLGDLDLRSHTRKDMTDLKARLMEGRKPSTVNKILIELSSVMTWGEDNGYLNKTFGKGLQIRKGSESEREAFTPTQVADLMAYANKLPTSSWQRWALSLGVVTGARIGEIYQITTEDLTKIEEQLVMDINTNDGKTLKNKFSARVVPVVSEHGVDVSALQAFAEAANGKLFKMSSSGFTTQLNQLIRDVLGTETNTGQSFHSLRHHLAGALKAAEAPLGIAQEILGHSSGSITFDLYGSGRAVQVDRMAEALRDALSDS
ncbi:tyrosine-type recombinase/integrase [Pseudomonas moorei]|uniref:tyrosine-type recombinase/integrase n=1 Tax=Pseudomonas moorei TaxID=395599 RepID=UPI0036F2A3D1